MGLERISDLGFRIDEPPGAGLHAEIPLTLPSPFGLILILRLRLIINKTPIHYPFMKTKTLMRTLFTLAAATVSAFPARATDLQFGYLQQPVTGAQGEVELENNVIWKTNRVGDRKLQTVEMRHEVEWGVTDRLQLAFYLANWSYTSRGEDRGFAYQSSAVEAVYALTDPEHDPVGSALYGEVKLGDQELELEGKLLLQKNVGAWIFGYNVGLEAGWEGRRFGQFEENTGEFFEALGVSRPVTRRVNLGVELLHEVEWPSWGAPEPSRLFVGPNASLRYGNWRAVLTPLFQLTAREGEPDTQARLIVAYEF
jgi:hypothetical protein